MADHAYVHAPPAQRTRAVYTMSSHPDGVAGVSTSTTTGASNPSCGTATAAAPPAGAPHAGVAPAGPERKTAAAICCAAVRVEAGVATVTTAPLVPSAAFTNAALPAASRTRTSVGDSITQVVAVAHAGVAEMDSVEHATSVPTERPAWLVRALKRTSTSSPDDVSSADATTAAAGELSTVQPLTPVGTLHAAPPHPAAHDAHDAPARVGAQTHEPDDGSHTPLPPHVVAATHIVEHVPAGK